MSMRASGDGSGGMCTLPLFMNVPPNWTLAYSVAGANTSAALHTVVIFGPSTSYD